jgi:hypothetical protein
MIRTRAEGKSIEAYFKQYAKREKVDNQDTLVLD